MQARPVRMKESRSSAPSSPHCLGHTQSIVLGKRGSDCIRISSRSFFPRREKRSLIPPCGPSHAIIGARVAPSTGISLRSHPLIKRKKRKRREARAATGSAACRYTRREGRLRFEKTGLSLFWLRGGAGGTWCWGDQEPIGRLHPLPFDAWFLGERASREAPGVPISGRRAVPSRYGRLTAGLMRSW